MLIRIFPAQNRSTINWSGGTSTEIFVHPADGDFAARNFDFRISTATVEVEESDFTFFESITRHLMILEGELELTHVDRYTKQLKQYGQDTFSGEWPTKSRGKVTDFNLMLKNDYTGKLEHRQLRKNESLSIPVPGDRNFLYVAEGALTIGEESANKSDLVEFSKELTISATESSDIILISVSLP